MATPRFKKKVFEVESDQWLVERGGGLEPAPGASPFAARIWIYHYHVEGQPFDIHTLLAAARRLELVGYEGTKRVRESGFAVSFEQAIRDACGDR